MQRTEWPMRYPTRYHQRGNRSRLLTPLLVALLAFDPKVHIIGDGGGTLFAMACLVWLNAPIILPQDLAIGKASPVDKN